MRAVMAVLRAASSAKRKEPEADEKVLILRTICDVNVPKFLSQDLPLFRGIIQDLFPGVEAVAKERKDMMEEIKSVCSSVNLQPKDSFLNKIIEIYDMLLVRHGFMVVGLPFAGKTSAMEVLQTTLGNLNKLFPEKHDLKWNPTHIVKINPKSLTLNNLYGSFDEQTHEWSDGVLAVKYRACSTTNANVAIGEQTDLKWILFDGPVDAIWIENMNTVLDDNRKLCLMSGEMLSMSDPMSMIFEPMDLEVASPATVSRCGMIYMEPDAVIGYESLIISWIQKMRTPKALSFKKFGEEENTFVGPFIGNDDEEKKTLQIFQWLAMPSIIYISKKCHSQARVEPLQLIANILKLMEATIANYLLTLSQQRSEPILKFKDEITEAMLEAIFLDALINAVGSIIKRSDHEGFSEFVRDISSSKTALEKQHGPVYRALILMNWEAPGFFAAKKKFRSLRIPLPPSGHLQDYTYSLQTRRWVKWEDTLKDHIITPESSFENIFVPTMATEKCKALLQRLVERAFPILLCGPTGTGKSALLKKLILNDLPQKEILPILVNFSAQTSVTQTQDIADAKLDKLRRGIFGPRGGKRCIIFVDEFNMPEVEEYGAQPPL
jgi:dynein heavy chain